MQYGPSQTPAQTPNQPTVIERPQLDTTSTDTTSVTAAADTAPQTTTAPAPAAPAAPVAFDRLLERFQSPNTLFIFGVLLATIILMRLVRKKYKANTRRSNTQPTPSQRIADIHQQAQSSMDPSRRVMVEAEEMARRLGATLDNKAARLELLIEEADQKLAILNRTLASSTPAHPTDPTPPPTQPTQPTQPTRTIDPSLLDRARLEQDHAERQTRVAGRIEPTLQEPKPDPEPQTIQSQVITLADSGFTSTEIAHKLDQPVGQVELILNLRKQQG